MFTLRLNSQTQLTKLSVGSEFECKVVVEGSLGKIKKLLDLEGTVLKIEFEEGEIYLDVNLQDLLKSLNKK
jgi:hypothetical protein